jgi:ribosome-interacting GTPase 1
MPANLTPEYQRAERRYREATEHSEKLAAMEEMLRVMPKHKGTDKLQADLKRRISQMRKSGPKKGGSHRDLFHVPRQGAGQVPLLGLPNSGKSSLVEALTRAHVKVAEYPFSTHAPVPGMAHFEDIPIQLVDMPPVTAEHVPPGMYGALRAADALLIVIDAASGSILEDLETAVEIMARRDVLLTSENRPPEQFDAEDRQIQKAIVVATKSDLPDAPENFATLKELYQEPLELLLVSSHSRDGLDQVPQALCELLDVIRIYAKPPGKPPDMTAPFVLPRGSTVTDLANEIHRGLAGKLRTTRVWGTGVFDGQQVPHDHVISDKDVVELNMDS